MLIFLFKKKRSLTNWNLFNINHPDSERTMCTFLGTAGKINEDDIHIKSLKKVNILFLKDICGMRANQSQPLIKQL